MSPDSPISPALAEMARLARSETAKAQAADGDKEALPILSEDEEKAPTLGCEENPPLSIEELQALREMLVRNSTRGREYYELPEKPVTDEDRQRFYDSVGDRKPFAETMVIIEKKLEVVFRCKTRREVEIIERQLQLDLEDQVIKNDRHFATAKSNYNLMFHMAALNGAECSNPAAISSSPNFSLRKHIDAHIISTLPEPVMFLLCGALAQFEKRVDIISKECLEASFIKPATL